MAFSYDFPRGVDVTVHPVNSPIEDQCEACDTSLGTIGVHWVSSGTRFGYQCVCTSCVRHAVEFAIDDSGDGQVEVEILDYQPSSSEARPRRAGDTPASADCQPGPPIGLLASIGADLTTEEAQDVLATLGSVDPDAARSVEIHTLRTALHAIRTGHPDPVGIADLAVTITRPAQPRRCA